MRSMTGFGTATVEKNGAYVSVSISAVNSRHYDVKVNLKNHPELMRKVVDSVRQSVDRGKIAVKCESNILDEVRENLVVDENMVESYLAQAGEISGNHDEVDDNLKLADILNLPGVIKLNQQPVHHEDAESLLQKAVTNALDKLIEMRKQEGQAIANDLGKRKKMIGERLREIRERVPEALERFRENLREQFQEILTLPTDEQAERLEREINIYAEKCDISEEVVRIESHLNQFENYLNQEDSVGKSLEFLMQEIQREINTIGAKANDAKISQLAVEIKAELEKCREQIKNVE